MKAIFAGLAIGALMAYCSAMMERLEIHPLTVMSQQTIAVLTR